MSAKTFMDEINEVSNGSAGKPTTVSAAMKPATIPNFDTENEFGFEFNKEQDDSAQTDWSMARTIYPQVQPQTFNFLGDVQLPTLHEKKTDSGTPNHFLCDGADCLLCRLDVPKAPYVVGRVYITYGAALGKLVFQAKDSWRFKVAGACQKLKETYQRVGGDQLWTVPFVFRLNDKVVELKPETYDGTEIARLTDVDEQWQRIKMIRENLPETPIFPSFNPDEQAETFQELAARAKRLLRGSSGGTHNV